MSDEPEVIETFDSQCATCGKHMEVEELSTDEGDEREFRGGCFLGAFSGHQFGYEDRELVFYQECKHCCPVCSREQEHES